MKQNWWKLLVVAALVVAVVVVVSSKGNGPVANDGPRSSITATEPSESTEPAETSEKQLPKILELGADKCVPCQKMQPIIAELEEEYEGKLVVESIDVWKNPGAGQGYRVRLIPTQIFFDENGEEFFRHTGFFSKEDILKTFEDQGISL